MSQVKSYLDTQMTNLVLQVTQNCNFRCEYCIYSENSIKQRHHSSKTMSFETAKKAVDFYFQHSIHADSIVVGFYGGEPLLEFALIKQVVKYTEDIFDGRDIRFPITTNGSLLTEEVADYLVRHDFVLSVSLDGPREVQDKNRRFANGEGTYDIVISNLEHIRRAYPEYKINIYMVVDPESKTSLERLAFYKFCYDNDFNIVPSLLDDFYSTTKNSFTAQQMEKIRYQEFLGYLYYMERIAPEQTSAVSRLLHDALIANMKPMALQKELPDVTSHGGPCIPGHRKLLVGVDGVFFPCEKVSELNCQVRIGSVESGFDVEQSKRLVNIAQLTEDKCKHCWAVNLCDQCIRFCGDDPFGREQKLQQCYNTKLHAEAVILDRIMLQHIS